MAPTLLFISRRPTRFSGWRLEKSPLMLPASGGEERVWLLGNKSFWKKMLELKTALQLSKHVSQHIISDELLYARCWGSKMYKTSPSPAGTQGLVGNA